MSYAIKLPEAEEEKSKTEVNKLVFSKIFESFSECSQLAVHEHSTTFSLHEEAVWLVEKGSLDLFAVKLHAPFSESRKSFIQEFGEETLLCGLPPCSSQEIRAFVEPGSQLKKIPLKILSAQLERDPSLQQFFFPLLNRWIAALLAPFSSKSSEKILLTHSTEGKEEIFLKKGDKVTQRHLVGGKAANIIDWFQVKKGKVLLFGWSDLSALPGSYLPLCSSLWWEAPEETVLEEISFLDFLKQSRWQEALTQFYSLFFHGLELFFHEKKQREENLMQERWQQEKQALSSSLLSLTTVLKEEEKVYERAEDPLLLACKVVGKGLNIEFKAPDSKERMPDINRQIRQICSASDVRYRQVTLRGNWYKQDCGSLVGFVRENEAPVALLSQDHGAYMMVDPKTQEIKKIDAESASRLSSKAFEFYSALPNEKLTKTAILKFLFFGRGKNVGLVFFVSFLITLLILSIPYGSSLIFGKAIPQLNKNLLWQVGTVLFVAAFSSCIYQLSQGFMIFRINSLSGNRFEAAIWDRILKFPATFFKAFSVGDLYNRINGFVTLRRAFNNYYAYLFLRALFSLVYFIAMCFFSLKLSLIALVAIFFGLGIFVLCQRSAIRMQWDAYLFKGKLNGFVLQILSGITKIRATGGEKHAFSYWAKNYAEIKKRDLKGQYYTLVIESVFAMMPTLTLILIFSVIIHSILKPEEAHTGSQIISLGNFFGFITAFAIFSSSLLSAVPAINYLYRVIQPIWKRGLIIFDSEVEVTEQKRMSRELQGGVSVEQLNFRYDAKSPYLLKNISFKAEPGEFIGIVGSSGCGKSTLLRLLLGFEIPEMGTISYDGEDLGHLDATSVRRQLGVVMQNSSILAGTIYENLAFGGIYTQEQVERVIELSAFAQDLWNFPMGLQTMLPSGGGTLSGGQKQRLLIARALISDPKILLFDEATSQLDNRTQRQLNKNIEKLKVTRIVVAHRLSSLRQSDRIYVLDKGEIVDQGSFDELAIRPGLFSQLVARQKI